MRVKQSGVVPLWLVLLLQPGRAAAEVLRAAVQPFHRRLEVAVEGLVVGLGQPGPRYLVSGEARWRFAGKLYALASGGALLFPEAGGTLLPGAFASFGLGVEHAR